MRNQKIFKAIFSVIVASQILTACSTNNSNSSNSSNKNSVAVITAAETVSVKYDKEDYYFDWESQNYKTLDVKSGSSSITKSGIYEITGTVKDGSITVDVDKSKDSGIVYLVLNNVNITSSTTAPINIINAKKVVLILENGTTNSISQGSNIKVDDNEPSAAIFSKSDITITGSGILNVNTDYNDGITSKDKLKITDGTINITSKADGIVGKDILAVKKANLTIKAGKDGMRSTNDTENGMGNIIVSDGTINIVSENDAIQTYGTLQIDGGTFNITTGGGFTSVTNKGMEGGPGGQGGPGNRDFQQGTSQDKQAVNDNQTAKDAKTSGNSNSETESESQKGLKTNGNLIVNDGKLIISSNDDSLHSAGKLSINGGDINIKSGDDALHSDTDVIINKGTITITNCYEGIEGKNITVVDGKINLVSSDDGFNVNDSNGVLKINGGKISVNAGGDGIDSNNTVEMNGGMVNVSGPTNNGNGSIDYQKSFSITGGTLVASGSSGMAQTPEGGTQPSILMYYSTTQSAGTVVTLKDSNGKEIVKYTPEKEYSSVAISSPDLAKGKSYTLYSNDKEVVKFTLSDSTTYINESGITTRQGIGGGMQGGKGGGQMPPNGDVPSDGRTPPNGDFSNQGNRPEKPQ